MGWGWGHGFCFWLDRANVISSSSFHKLDFTGPNLLALCLRSTSPLPHLLQPSPGQPAGFGWDAFDTLLEASRHQCWFLLHSTGSIYQVATLLSPPTQARLSPSPQSTEEMPFWSPVSPLLVALSSAKWDCHSRHLC